MGLRAKTAEEYVRLIEQVIDELEDIREVSGYAFDDDQGNCIVCRSVDEGDA